MCVAQTARRRRRQMRLDKRFKRSDPVTSARRLQRVKEKEMAMKSRKSK
jgi:hypothetical protein